MKPYKDQCNIEKSKMNQLVCSDQLKVLLKINLRTANSGALLDKKWQTPHLPVVQILLEDPAVVVSTNETKSIHSIIFEHYI
jgi:hypothetical protein